MPAPHRPYLTAFYGHPDYYQVAAAVAEVGALDRLFTDYYTVDRLLPLARMLPASMRHKFTGRNSELVPSRLVSSPPPVRATALAMRSRFGGETHVDRVALADRVGRAAGAYARTSDAVRIVYSDCWPGYLAGLDGTRCSTPDVIWQMHPMPRQIRRIMATERARNSFASPPREEELLTEAAVETYERQVMQADAALVASRFVARGLEEIGYPNDRIHVVPYGGDFGPRRLVTPAVDRRSADGTLRVLFVGQLLPRKGWHLLIDAVAGFSPEELTLTMLCREQQDRATLGALPPNVTMLRGVTETELVQLYADHDVFTLPSLIEGFGLVLLEALGQGLPIICTDNTGGPDVITDGEEGIVVEAGSAQALRSAFAELVGNRPRVRRMSERAQITGRTLTWERFRSGVREALGRIEQTEVHPRGSLPRAAEV